jgi:hypothetical protein
MQKSGILPDETRKQYQGRLLWEAKANPKYPRIPKSEGEVA